MGKKFLIIIVATILYHSNTFSQLKITSSSFVSKTISSGFISEAGMDFQEEFLFSSDQIVLSVNILPQNLDNVIYNSWQIQVSKNDLEWNNDLDLWIKRSSDGKSDYNNKPQNGTSYQKVELYNTAFFEGQGWINTIPIQLKISGLSVLLPAKSYTTEIIFTLIDN